MGDLFNTLLVLPLANGLVFFYQVLGQNMGLAIIFFSLALRLVLTPLTKPALESMKKMRALQPQLKKLQKKYKDDKPGYLKAQAEVYKQNGINPGAGCLPQILQLVILIALYQVFTRLLSDHGQVPDSINNLLYGPLRFGEGATLNTQFLYADVTQPDKFMIPGLPFPLPGLFVILAALVQFVAAKISLPYIAEEKQVAEKTKGEVDDMMTSMQSSMVYTFPLMTLIIGLSFPSGLALYWLVFSAHQAYQQYKMFGFGSATPWVDRAKALTKAKSV